MVLSVNKKYFKSFKNKFPKWKLVKDFENKIFSNLTFWFPGQTSEIDNYWKLVKSKLSTFIHKQFTNFLVKDFLMISKFKFKEYFKEKICHDFKNKNFKNLKMNFKNPSLKYRLFEDFKFRTFQEFRSQIFQAILFQLLQNFKTF